MSDLNVDKVAVVGLGYVGLPLAVALARHLPCTGFDVNTARVAELRRGEDSTHEVDAAMLASSTLKLTDQADEIADHDIYIVTVPTPVDNANLPDLGAVCAASACVGKYLKPGRNQIVVFESTVYPGVTEEVCGPILEKISGLICGVDFTLGYSPERINPGDRVHTVDKIMKVISGQTPETTERLAAVYGVVTSGGLFRAASIKVAEAAKVIENAQRDINIAFMNEITMIFQKAGISIHDVLDAASTKWNFLSFSPGFVGGHCIGVDPFYLSHLAQKLGHHPGVILSGRRINDGMGHFVADNIHSVLGAKKNVLVLGLTFKEDVPDLRNSKVKDLVRRLVWLGHDVTVHDPLADPDSAYKEHGIVLSTDALDHRYDAVILAVSHKQYCAFSAGDILKLVRPGGVVADVKGKWRKLDLPESVRRWQL